MESVREQIQIFVRRFGLLNASCCETCCEEQVSLLQSHILCEIRRTGDPAMQQVADELGIDITTFSRQVKSLEKRRFIVRRMSPKDRRVTLLGLTDEGKRVLEQIDRYMTKKIEDIFSLMSPFERETVTRSLGLLNGVLATNGNRTKEKLACCK